MDYLGVLNNVLKEIENIHGEKDNNKIITEQPINLSNEKEEENN